MNDYTITSTETPVTYTQEQYDQLNKNYESALDRLRKRNGQVDILESFLKDNYSDMDPDHVEEIAHIFNFTMTKTYDVTITVRFSGTVEVPLGYDIDNLENQLSASIDSYYASDVELDLMEDQMEIDAQESQ